MKNCYNYLWLYKILDSFGFTIESLDAFVKKLDDENFIMPRIEFGDRFVFFKQKMVYPCEGSTELSDSYKILTNLEEGTFFSAASADETTYKEIAKKIIKLFNLKTG